MRNGNVKRKTYSVEQVQALTKRLTALPQKPKSEIVKRDLVAAEVVRLARKEIRTALAKGYSLEEIVNAAKTEGFDLGTPTLKKYLRTPTKPTAKRRTAAEKTAAGTTNAAAEVPTPTAAQRHILPQPGEL